VNPALSLTPSTLSSLLTGTTYALNFTGSGGSGTGYSYTFTGSAIPGMTFSGSSLSGIPTTAGRYPFTVTLKDSLGYQTVNSYTLVISAPISVQPTSISSGQAGVAYTQTFTASGGTGGPYTWTVSPTNLFGLSFSPTPGISSQTATLSGTPTSFGTTSITVTASDGTLQGQATYTLTITPATLTLSAPGSYPAIATTGSTFAPLSLTAAGGLGTYTFSFTGTPPPGLMLTPNGSSVSLGGTLTTAGAYSFGIQVSDTSKTASQSFSITINNPALTLTPTSLPAGVLNSSYSQTFTAHGGNNGPYTYSLVGSTPGLTFNTSTGVLSGTLTSSSTYSFTVGVTDGSSFTPQFTPVGYTIAVNQPVSVGPASIPAADAGVTYTATFVAAGGSGKGYTYAISTLPGGLSFSSSTGVLTGQPAAGTTTFTVTATDSNGTMGTSPSYTLTVNPALTLTSAGSGPEQTGSAPTAHFNAAGGSGGYAFSLAQGPLPAGTNLNTNGTLSGTYTAAGSYPVSITVKDSLGTSVTNNFTLTVNNPPLTLSLLSPLTTGIVNGN
jgi:hypothetical protein